MIRDEEPFSAYGYFEVNNSTYLTILSQTVSYLVILVSFSNLWKHTINCIIFHRVDFSNFNFISTGTSHQQPLSISFLKLLIYAFYFFLLLEKYTCLYYLKKCNMLDTSLQSFMCTKIAKLSAKDGEIVA